MKTMVILVAGLMDLTAAELPDPEGMLLVAFGDNCPALWTSGDSGNVLYLSNCVCNPV